MQILPAIDIKDGQAVRLFKGDFNQQTVVNPDVIEQAKTLETFSYSIMLVRIALLNFHLLEKPFIRFLRNLKNWILKAYFWLSRIL